MVGLTRTHRVRTLYAIFVLLTSLLLSACVTLNRAALRPTATSLTSVLPTTPIAHATDQMPTLPGWNLAWADDFDGSAVNPQHWVEVDSNANAHLGCCLRFGNQAWSPDNLKVSGGQLQITTKQVSSESYHYSSGAISSEGLHSLLYGRVDIRAKLPASTSLWPAFWLVSDNVPAGKAAPFEIDFTEAWGSDPHTVYAFFHWDRNQSYCQRNGPNFASGYHIFTLIWGVQSMDWFVDGEQQCEIISHVPNTPMHLIIDTAIDGASEPVDHSTILPQTTSIDYVYVWKSH